MTRRKLTLRIDSEVIDKAKEMGVNLSGFLEIKLIEHIYKKYGLEKRVLPSGILANSSMLPPLGRLIIGSNAPFGALVLRVQCSHTFF